MRATMNGPRITGLLRPLAPYLALWLVCSALVTAVAIYAFVADRERDRISAQKDAANLTHLMQAQAMRTLDGIDQALSLVRAIQERRLSGLSPRSLFETLHLGDDALRPVAVFDRDGRFVTSTDGESEAVLAGVSVADRDYFRAARNGKPDVLILAEPLKGRVSGRLVVPAAKRVTSPSGEFDGVVVSALDAARLIDVYRDISLGDGGFVGVALRNGRIIAESAPGADKLPVGSAELPLAGDQETAWAVLDGSDYLLATRPLQGTELLVFVARPERDVLAGNTRFAEVIALLAGLALVALALPIGYTARRSLRMLRERQALQVRASIDPLTQAYNRHMLEDRLLFCLHNLANDGLSFALAFIDIDNFKTLNDSRGHAEGDRALARIAGILQTSVRKTDVVSRVGGDEFAILLPGSALAATRRVFDQVIEMLRVLARREQWPISFSVGVVTFLASPRSASEAIALADRVMYTVKQTTKDGVCFALHDQRGLQVETSAPPLGAERRPDATSSGHSA